MKFPRVGRRDFLKELTGAAAIVPALGGERFPPERAGNRLRIETARQIAPAAAKGPARIKFAVIGLKHSHINGQTTATIRGGGELVSVYAKEPELVEAFVKRFPQAKVARTENEILEDKAIQLVVSAGIPDERAPLGVRVMQHGKDYMVDKPGITTLEQLAEVRKVQAQTRRIYSIMYSERMENKATVRAGDLVKSGAIGRVIQTIGVGPHKMTPQTRPAWFFERPRYGGILCDIGSHQGDQFLYFTGSTQADVVASQVGNVNNPKYPGLEDFGDTMVRGNGGTGYIRVDWFTPETFPVFGDGRLTILGTDGFIEVRKNIDIAGRPGGSHLILVDKKETRYVDCASVDLPYGGQLVDDVVNRTETAMPQAHCLLATELMLKAQKQAQRVTTKPATQPAY
jgi:predicted dehydrogenase